MNATVCTDCGGPKAKPESERCRSCAGKHRHASGRHGRPWNADRRVTLTCAVCTATFTVVAARAATAKTCGRTCSDEARRRLRGSGHPLAKPKVPKTCEVCGTVCEVKPSLAERFRFCSRNCTGAWVIAHRQRSSTTEDAVAQALDERGIAYERQVLIGAFVSDFLIDGGVALEVDGEYWHSLPKVQARDERKRIEYERRGVPLVRITEAEVLAGDFAALDALHNAGRSA